LIGHLRAVIVHIYCRCSLSRAFVRYLQLTPPCLGLDSFGHLVPTDSWQYIWGNTKYTSAKFYHLSYKYMQPPRPFIWIWDSKCSNKIKVFTWLLMINRLNVRNILRRRKYRLEGNDYSCPLCARNREDTTFHLFFTCPFSFECWRHLGFNWNFNLDFHSMMLEAKQQCSSLLHGNLHGGSMVNMEAKE
jgi:hypothetical protein